MRAIPARLGLPAIGLGAITVAAMMSGATHTHSHDAGEDHSHAEATDDQGGTTTVHSHRDRPGRRLPTPTMPP